MDSAQAVAFSASLTGKTIGGWLVADLLGFGKSAVVMRASKDGEHGALKAFHPELVERYGEAMQVERIEREKRLIGLAHANLVKILDGGKCPVTRTLFVVMELIPYKNLKQVLLDVPVNKVRGIVSQLAAAAYFLEEHGIVHRDIKPENIAISEDFEHVKLLDLGVLLPIGIAGLTDVNSRTFIGTLRYSSPEFLERKERQSTEGWRAVTFYQLGAVLHDLLMRKQIFFDRSEPYAILVKAVLEATPEVYGDDTKLVRICSQALIKNPATRLQLLTWNDFLDVENDKNFATITNRIAGRQKGFLSKFSTPGIPLGEHDRLLNLQLVNLCQQIEVRLGILFVDLPYFPLRKTETIVDPKLKLGQIFVFFEKNPQIGLPFHLSLHLQVSRIDENNGNPIYSLNGGASLSPDEVPFNDVKVDKKICVGTSDDISSTSNLSEFLLSSLELSYQYIETHGGAIRNLVSLEEK